MKLELKAADAPPAPPRAAATIVLLRDGDPGLETFCVVRSGRSSFLAGALVFPGGRVDDADRAWLPNDAFALAAIRETLEEAGILLARGLVNAAHVEALRRALLGGESLRALLEPAGIEPAVEALVPFARWITPAAETKRFDTHFFIARAPSGQRGSHDDGETVDSLWAAPAELLARWERGELALVPPTHATLEWLGQRGSVQDALDGASELSLAPICPELTEHDGAQALLLPGDPLHTIAECTHPYARRYRLTAGRFTPDR